MSRIDASTPRALAAKRHKKLKENRTSTVAFARILPVRCRPIYQRRWTKVNVPSNLLDSLARRKTRPVLACLLLVTIGYGAIVEAAHSHGFSSSRPSQITAVSDGSDSHQLDWSGVLPISKDSDSGEPALPTIGLISAGQLFHPRSLKT